MPDTFITDWKKIGQSGPTMDGREIEAQWLTDAAESYAPGTYTAVIWIDHFRFYGSMGKIVALKAEEKDGVVSLYAKLQPNEWLLSQNRNKQKLFTSMELTPDFAKTGKCYLTGLAVTDIPASLGTTELHFSHRKQHPDELFIPGVELDDLSVGETSEPEAPTWFTQAMLKLGINLTHKQGATPEPEEDTMTDEQMKQFAEIVGDSVGKRLDGLKVDLDQKFAALTPGESADQNPDDKDGAVSGEGQQNFSTEITEAMKPVAEKLDSIQKEFNSKVDDLTKRFEQVNPGTQAPESTQPASDAGAEYL